MTKKSWFGHRRICLNALVAFFAIAMMASSSLNAAEPAASGNSGETPANWPKTFELVYCWGGTTQNDIDAWCPCAELTLHRRPKTFDVFDCLSGNFVADAGTWSKKRRWREITFELSNGVVYHGVEQPDGTYFGTMLTPNGVYGVWSGEFVP